jgi:hypothetical protein
MNSYINLILEAEGAKGRLQRLFQSVPEPEKRGCARLCLSEELALIVERSSKEVVRVEHVISFLHERAYTFLLLLLSLPFIQPIPVPGLSSPFGVIIALLGLGLLIGRKLWLPRHLLNLELPKSFVDSALGILRRLVRALEMVLRPRMIFLTDHLAMRRLRGFCILVCGFLLCLPLPIPFTNMVPAVTVILFAASMIGKDGYFFFAAIVMFIVTIAFFGAIGVGGVSAVKWAYEWLACLGWRDDKSPEQMVLENT